MSHQPFEEWIFQDEDLSLEQRGVLHVHLDGCSRCCELYGAWGAAQSELIGADLVGPGIGFAARWRARYAEQWQRTAKRQVSWTLGLTILGAGALAVPLIMQVYAAMESPAVVGGSVIQGALSLDLTLKLGGGLLRALLNHVMAQLAPTGWAGMGLGLLTFTTIWMLSLYRFAFQPVKRGGRNET